MLEGVRRLLVLFMLAACSAAPSAPKAPLRAEAAAPAKASGVAASFPPSLPELRVGTSGDYAPFSLLEASGSVQGFDAELGQAIARDLGFKLRWVQFRWPELGRRLQSGDFDVAMSGVTWQPTRAVSGFMTRVVARGGPCILGDAGSARIGVNRGGALESWARQHFAGRELVTVDENQTLPALLAAGTVGAIVTDSFERKAFARPGFALSCEPALAQKVYWVAPARAAELGARIDGWLRSNTARVQVAQERWFGEHQRLDAGAELIDLLARRFAFMPLVAAIKAKQNLPVEDLPRERELLAATADSGARSGLGRDSVLELFRVLIELSKDVQRRRAEPNELDLKEQIRPALNELGARILTALAEARRQKQLEALSASELEALSPWLTLPERERVRSALRGIELAAPAP